jgi:P2 family phage contractile tail tube protein
MNGYIFEGVNMFVGDDGPDNSKHLTLESVKLPDLEETSQEHFGGGAVGAIMVGGLGLKALEVGFKCKGFDPQLKSHFGLGAASKRRIPFTIYGAYRDLQGGDVLEMKAIAEGRLASIAGDDMKRGELQGFDYKITEILRYRMYFGNKEKLFYDYFNSEWRVDGVSQNAEVNNILRIPTSA